MPHTGTNAATRGWAVVGLVVVLEYALFRQYVLREVAWAYPMWSDQVAYLGRAYATFEQIHTTGLLRGAYFGITTPAPTGILPSLMAALLFPFFGVSRLTALMCNFVFFAAFQIVLVATIRWFTDRWSIALLGLGLTMLPGALYHAIGGPADFRLDFIALCSLGIFITVVLRSGVFSSPRWSVVVGVAGAVLVLDRFVTGFYLLGIYAAMGIALLMRLWRPPVASKPLAVQVAKQQLAGLFLSGSVLSVLAGPVVVMNARWLRGYYVGTRTGSARRMWRAAGGLTSLRDDLLAYPRTLARVHLDRPALGAFAVTLAIAATVWALGRREPEPTAAKAPMAWWFLIVSFGMPLAILTIDPVKQVAVAGIFVPPVLWIVVFAVLRASRTLPASAPHLADRLLAALATLVLLLGLYTQISRRSETLVPPPFRMGVRQVSAIADIVYERSARGGWRKPVMFADGSYDFGASLKPFIYERHGELLEITPSGLGDLGVTGRDALLSQLARSDFAILTQAADTPARFPLERATRALSADLAAYCERYMTLLGTYHVYSWGVRLYARPVAPQA